MIGSVNTPGVSKAELDAVKQAALTAQQTANEAKSAADEAKTAAQTGGGSSSELADALGFYIDDDGDLAQKDDEESD